MKRKRARKKFSGKKRVAIFGVSLTVLIVAFMVVMGFGGLFSPSEYADDPTENLAEIDKQTGKINILVVGLDKDGYRTDTILVATYDMDNDIVNILSIPRDTRMYVGGNYQKINCAYAITKNGKRNGINGTIEAVTRLTAIPINYYVEFTFEAFRDMIDALGGVDYDVPQNMNYDDPYQDLHIHLTKGYQHLDGDKAEQFVRFRKYPMGDIDRVKAQQNFIKALAEQKLNASIIGKLSDIFKVLQKNIKTNFKPSDVLKYAVNLKDLESSNINTYSLPGIADSESYGASYWIADMAELKTLIEETFGYDASKITIHSADGKSIVKDVKKVKTVEEPIKEEETKVTEPTSAEKKKTETKKTEVKTVEKTEVKTSEDSEKNETAEKAEDDTEKSTKKEIVRPSANPVSE